MDPCTICFDAPPDCIIVPCGHKCGCLDCLTRFRDEKKEDARCPMCLAKIVQLVEDPTGLLSQEASDGEPASPLATPVNVLGFGEDFETVDVTLEVLPVPEEVEGEEMEEDAAVPVVFRISVPDPEPGQLNRIPVDVACVVDISGSMGQDATYENAVGEVQSDGLSILNVVQHAVKVLLASLKAEDRFSLVTFNQNAEMKYPLSNVTRVGRAGAIACLEVLRPEGQTSIWAGIRLGMETLRSGAADAAGAGAGRRTKVVLLLTDGVPTESPPEGHAEAFHSYCRQHNFDCQLNCVGFGYTVDSDLLLRLSSAGGGTFAFVPSSPVLETVFTNAISSILCTHAVSSSLTIEAPSENCFVREGESGKVVVGGLPTSLGRDNKELKVTLGPLLYGQVRDVVVMMRPKYRFGGGEEEEEEEEENVFVKASLEYGDGEYVAAKGTQTREIASQTEETEIAALRVSLIEECLKAVHLAETDALEEAQQVIEALGTKIEESSVASDERVVALHKDVSGRVTKALDGLPRFQRWGQHYIRALVRAHALQQCTNSLDFGLQMYGHEMFSLLRQRGNALFLSLPPPAAPKPICCICGEEVDKEILVQHTEGCITGVPYVPRAERPAAAPYVPRRDVDMNSYTYGGGGCFGGSSTVVVVGGEEEENQTIIRMDELKKGDWIAVAGGDGANFAQVVCVVKTVVRSDPAPLVAIPGGPLITPKHPVRVDGVWRFPEGMGPRVPTEKGDGTVFNFVLEPRDAIAIVDGFECVALGHGLKDEEVDVVEHGFYGSEAVVDELKMLEGWEKGFVSVGACVRNDEGHAVGFVDAVSNASEE